MNFTKGQENFLHHWHFKFHCCMLLIAAIIVWELNLHLLLHINWVLFEKMRLHNRKIWWLQNMKISTDILILCLRVLVIRSFVSGGMTSQSFLLDKRTSHRHPIFTPGIRQNSKKITFFCLKTSFPTQIYVTLYFYNCSNRLVDRFCQNSAKMCLNSWL